MKLQKLIWAVALFTLLIGLGSCSEEEYIESTSFTNDAIGDITVKVISSTDIPKGIRPLILKDKTELDEFIKEINSIKFNDFPSIKGNIIRIKTRTEGGSSTGGGSTGGSGTGGDIDGGDTDGGDTDGGDTDDSDNTDDTDKGQAGSKSFTAELDANGDYQIIIDLTWAQKGKGDISVSSKNSNTWYFSSWTQDSGAASWLGSSSISYAITGTIKWYAILELQWIEMTRQSFTIKGTEPV